MNSASTSKMLDIQFIREKQEQVKEGVKSKGYEDNLVDEVLAVDERRRHLLQEVESLRKERNELSKKQDETLRARGREIKEKLKQCCLLKCRKRNK